MLVKRQHLFIALCHADRAACGALGLQPGHGMLHQLVAQSKLAVFRLDIQRFDFAHLFLRQGGDAVTHVAPLFGVMGQVDIQARDGFI